MRDLRGKNAILTGGSMGLGVHIARALAREGVNLALAARSADKLEAVADEVAALGVRAIAVPTDVSKAADREALVARAEAELGAIDILINNAGVEQIIAFDDETPENITRTIEVNLLATMLLTKLVLPAMLARKQGHIISMASLAGKKGAAYIASYSASKAGLIVWNSALRGELRGSGVSASVICPGYVSEVGMFARHRRRAPLMMGEPKPEQVAKATVRAIKRDLPEVIVNPLPTRLLFAINALSPRLGSAIIRQIGVVAMQRDIAQNYKGEH